MKTRVVLVDDHEALRQMLGMVLSRLDDMNVVAETGSGLDALKLCKTVAHDIVILDLILPELSGLEVLRRLREEMPESRVLVYSGTRNQQTINRAIQLRPHAFVEKAGSLETLREAMKAVLSGSCYFSHMASGIVPEIGGRRDAELTAREIEVLQLVAESRSTKEIASRLGLSTKTVENHRANIMCKLRAHDVAALTRYAILTGLVTAE